MTLIQNPYDFVITDYDVCVSADGSVKLIIIEDLRHDGEAKEEWVKDLGPDYKPQLIEIGFFPCYAAGLASDFSAIGHLGHLVMGFQHGTMGDGTPNQQ